MKIIAYFDGACEPVNPGGTASYGAVVFIDGKRVWETSDVFYPLKGKEKQTSNNVAEYCAFLEVLKYLKEQKLHEEEIRIYGDSNLVIKQMFGTWGIHNGFYVEIALKAREALKSFTNIKGRWIPREANGIADELSKARLVKAGIKFRIQPR